MNSICFSASDVLVWTKVGKCFGSQGHLYFQQCYLIGLYIYYPSVQHSFVPVSPQRAPPLHVKVISEGMILSINNILFPPHKLWLNELALLNMASYHCGRREIPKWWILNQSCTNHRIQNLLLFWCWNMSSIVTTYQSSCTWDIPSGKISIEGGGSAKHVALSLRSKRNTKMMNTKKSVLY